MNFARLGGSLLAGTVAFLVVFVSLTAALDPYVWPSALLSLPIAVVLGAGTAVLTGAGLAYRAATASAPDGPDAERARTRFVAVMAGLAAFLVVGVLAAVLAGTVVTLSYLAAVLFVGFPAGLLAAVLAGLVTVSRRSRRTDGSRPAT